MAEDGSEIRAIEARLYRCPLDEPFGYSRGWVTVRESAVARVVTVDGTVGWGEAYAPAAPAATAIESIGRRFVGRSVFERVAVARAIDDRPTSPPERTLLAAARSAVATAAGDAAAKLVELPVRALLGGLARPTLRPYASGLWFKPGPDPMWHYDEAVRALLGRGFTAVKAKIGVGPEADLRAIARLVEAAGDAAVMVDANQAYAVDEARIVLDEAAGSGLVWIEEPLPPACLDDYAALRAGTTVPLAGGETMTSLAEACSWLDTGAVDVVQPDLCLVGGFDDAAVISAMAAAAGVVVAPHCFGLGLGLAAALHWSAAIGPDGGDGPPVWVEIDTAPHPVRDLLLEGCDWFGEGGARLSVPNAPGLGVDLDRIERFRVR